MLKSRKGQALIEAIPSLLIFITVITAAFTYFKVMRFSAIRQEVARNLIFSKINNSGTLTFQAVAPGNGSFRENPYLSFQENISNSAAIQIPDRGPAAELNRNNTCLRVLPNAVEDEEQNFSKIIGANLNEITRNIKTQSVIYRAPGANCQ